MYISKVKIGRPSNIVDMSCVRQRASQAFNQRGGRPGQARP